ncbi:MAG: polyketide cyclase [Methylocystis sp.]|nr:MAG: polyketide cyclase [Methylocystis sp.]
MSSLSRRAALLALAALAPLASSAARAAGAEPPIPGPNSWAAHGAAPLKSVETITIEAPPEKVWAVLSDFARYDWLPGVARVEASGGNVPEKGKRRLVMADGGSVEETLVRWDAERMTLAFHRDRDDVKRLPAINYMTHVTAKPADGGKTLAEWKGRFYRGHPFNDPPPGLDDDTALAAVTALHRANLAALKAKVEGK